MMTLRFRSGSNVVAENVKKTLFAFKSLESDQGHVVEFILYLLDEHDLRSVIWSYSLRLSWTYSAFDRNAYGNATNANWASAYCGSGGGVGCEKPMLKISAIRDVMGRIGSLQTEFGHPNTPGNAVEHQTKWRGYGYDMRGALTQVYKHEASESVALDITALTGLNHTLTSSTLNGFATGNTDKWNYLRESKIGSLVAIENVQTGLDEWATTRPRLAGPAGEQRGVGHRLDHVAVDSTSYLIEHDESGRITTALDHTLAYDKHGRLIAAYDATYTRVETYAYDARGQISAVFDGNANLKHHYVYDGPQIISAFDGNGALEWEAVWGQQIDQLYAFRDVANNSGQLVPLADHRNSIVGTFSTSLQNIDQIAEYDPHGRVTLRNSNETVVCQEAGNAGIRCDAPSGLPFGFASALRSDVTGLVYMRNRWYSPRLGQFITHDPLGYIDAHNPYAYVAFDPINFLDPYGLNMTGGMGGNRLTQAEADKFGHSRDPNKTVDPKDLVAGATKQVGNEIVDNFRMANCMIMPVRCAIDTHQNGISPPVFQFDNPDQEMAGNMVATASAVGPGKITKVVGWAAKTLKGLRFMRRVPVNMIRRRKYVLNPKHGTKQRGIVSPAPTNGQKSLDSSLAVKKTTTPRRVAVDKEAKEFIVFDETNPGTGIFHGHTRPWSGGDNPLTQKMQSVLRKAGLVSKKGKIL